MWWQSSVPSLWNNPRIDASLTDWEDCPRGKFPVHSPEGAALPVEKLSLPTQTAHSNQMWMMPDGNQGQNKVPHDG